MNRQTTAMGFSPLLLVACDKAPEADTAAQAAGDYQGGGGLRAGARVG